MIEAIKMGFQKYAQFGGRSSRSEYWWWALFVWVVNIALESGMDMQLATAPSNLFLALISLALFIPSLAIACRRMHDIGKGGGWICINFVPVIGWIWFFILCCQPSEMTPNRFGDVPNEI